MHFNFLQKKLPTSISNAKLYLNSNFKSTTKASNSYCRRSRPGCHAKQDKFTEFLPHGTGNSHFIIRVKKHKQILYLKLCSKPLQWNHITILVYPTGRNLRNTNPCDLNKSLLQIIYHPVAHNWI